MSNACLRRLTLQIEGLPPVTLDEVEKAGRYIYSRSATLQSWHPTKREMLVTTRFGETIQAHRDRDAAGAEVVEANADDLESHSMSYFASASGRAKSRELGIRPFKDVRS